MAVTVSRILHAGYIFRSETTEVVFDPIFETPFSRNCYPFPQVQFVESEVRRWRPSAVFISHFHDDHCSFDSLNLLDRRTPIYMFCVFSEMFSWLEQLGFEKVTPLALNEPVQIGDFEIIPRRALDEDVDSLFQINVQGMKILNVVDSWIDDEVMKLLENQQPWDLVLWPFQTMNEMEVIAPNIHRRKDPEIPAEWLEQMRVLAPRNIIPSSCQFIHEEWSWYRYAYFPISYKFFAEKVADILPQARVTRVNPGESLLLDGGDIKPASRVPWILPVGDQDLDYSYDPSKPPMSTAEIAKNFSALSSAGAEAIDLFCKSGIGEKYRDLDHEIESYFASPRVWKLSVFDDRGEVTEWFYRVENQGLHACGPTSEVSWSTEIPVAKLFSALTTGESLSSIYVQIDCTDKNVDLLEDPLLRCLFNQEFGTYQRAQLERLLQFGRGEVFL